MPSPQTHTARSPAADPELHIPHFEKMLYDNPQLAATYLDAFACTRDPELAGTARGILDYLLRDMQHASGAFFSAEVGSGVAAAG